MAETDVDIKEMQKWFQTSEDYYNPWKMQAQEDERFYLGKQWDSEDMRLLKEQKRPALTFNHLLSLINLVSGFQRRNRQDIKVYNRREGTEEMAKIFTHIIKDIHHISNGDFEVSMAFLLGIITGRAFLNVNVDFDQDPYNGQIKIATSSPFEVFPDPFHERYDLSDAGYLFITPWLSKRKLDLLYSEKKEEMESIEVDESDRLPLSGGEERNETYATGNANRISEKDKYKYRLKQCWYKEYLTETFLYDTNNGTAKRTELAAAHIAKILKHAPNWRKIKRVTPLMKLKTYVGNVLLEDLTPFGNKERKVKGLIRFPVAPFYAYWLEGEHFSMITQLKDPQREINKRYSQLLHHLNMSANSGWIGDPEAVKDWDKLETMGSRAGVTIKVKPHPQAGISGSLQRISPNQLSEGHLILAKEGANQIKYVSGINADLLSQTEAGKESGIAMQIRQRQGILGLEPVMDNFRITKQLLGKILIEYIQKSGAYSQEEVLNLMVDGKVEKASINQKKRSRLTFWVNRVINDVHAGEYDAVVSQRPTSATSKQADFFALIEAAKAGIQIPPSLIVEMSDLPEKEEILESLKAGEEARNKAAQGEQAIKQEELNIKKLDLSLKANQAKIDSTIKLMDAEKDENK